MARQFFAAAIDAGLIDKNPFDRLAATIHTPKTAHHASGGVRQCPIFPELRHVLEAAWDAAEPGTEFVVNRYRESTQNLRTTFQKIIKRAGLVPWPKLFQNLRASRETELLAIYPAKDVASWLGNSVPVAMKHYAMPRAETFERAAREPMPVEQLPAEMQADPEVEQTGGIKSGTTSGRQSSPSVAS